MHTVPLIGSKKILSKKIFCPKRDSCVLHKTQRMSFPDPVGGELLSMVDTHMF